MVRLESIADRWGGLTIVAKKKGGSLPPTDSLPPQPSITS